MAGAGCGTLNKAAPEADGPRTESGGTCPPKGDAPGLLPGVTAEHRTAKYWIARSADADRVLLDGTDIRRHRDGLRSETGGEPRGQMDLRVPLDTAWLGAQLTERAAFVRERLANGTYLAKDGARVEAASIGLAEPPRAPTGRGTIHRAEDAVAIHCAPSTASLFTKDLDLAFDRNLCSTARKGELIEVMSREGSAWLARTGYTLGWIAPTAKLSKALGEAEVAAELGRAPAHPALTRRALLTEAFALLDEPYGWGGAGGGRDCSQFLLDVFAKFGIELPAQTACARPSRARTR
jgi:cell wall-associated NlpC family hydrolase